ncbi:hypothetical protein mvi_61050 (plasmid) [Methylobacterium indicum]|uniref:Uncharacterized protein n=1 Tax=Methylobacterium indicum TaxID=1775910 RepID=A0A8H8X078_9HYPH|nr:hypothetical protein mvi_61050 [Methylobacterium indicum]
MLSTLVELMMPVALRLCSSLNAEAYEAEDLTVSLPALYDKVTCTDRPYVAARPRAWQRCAVGPGNYDSRQGPSEHARTAMSMPDDGRPPARQTRPASGAANARRGRAACCSAGSRPVAGRSGRRLRLTILGVIIGVVTTYMTGSGT